MSAVILRFPGVTAEHDRWNLDACRRRESFAGMVDRLALRWPALSREEAERKAHAMLLQLQSRLNAAGL